MVELCNTNMKGGDTGLYIEGTEIKKVHVSKFVGMMIGGKTFLERSCSINQKKIQRKS